MLPFITNPEYIRKHLHDQFKGNRQSGISSSSAYPYIFIFTGKSGIAHGYEDRWINENTFEYTGEGQKGDMTFIKGNKALLNHKQDGKSVFLFEILGKGKIRFLAELQLNQEPMIALARNSSGINRKVIKFRFSKVGDSSLDEVAGNVDINVPSETERRGLVKSRIGQGWYRDKILKKWKHQCAVTKVALPAILIASHILPWRDATNEQRLDPENGILLSPNLDALFDQHLISFADSGDIIFSKKINEKTTISLGINRKMKIDVTEGMKKYLAMHRAKVS